MKNVEIAVFPIAKTTVQPLAVRKWLERLEVSSETIDDYLSCDLAAPTDPALLIALAAKRCYNSFEVGHNPNISKVRSDLTEYLDNVLKSGHGSVCEHSCYSFAIEGVSRVFTAEMNRHRVGVGISEASMRYIRFDDIPWWMPNSIREDPSDSPEISKKKADTRDVFNRVFAQAERDYSELQNIWAEELAPNSKFHLKKQITSMMRRTIPMGVATGGVWTMNMRALRHIIALRASEAAEEEICHVFSLIARHMVGQEPMLLGDFGQTPEGFWVPKYKKV